MDSDTATPNETKDLASEQGAVFEHPPDTIKSSERFSEFLKSEQERTNGKIKTAEDRARGNSTAIVGAVALVTLLRTVNKTTPLFLLATFIIGTLICLGLTTAILYNRSTSAVTTEWMDGEQERLWNEDRSYLEVMRLYQKAWIRNIKELQTLEDQKYLLLHWQNNVLLATLFVLIIMLGWAGITLK